MCLDWVPDVRPGQYVIVHVGFAIAVGVTEAMALLPIREFVGTPEISGVVALAAVAMLAAIGLTAGLLPARRAATLDVVEALRS